MQRKALGLGSLLAAAFVVACQEPTSVPTAIQPAVQPAGAAAPRTNGAGLPRGWHTRSISLPSSVAPVAQVFTETGPRAINPDDYVCSGGSAITNYLNAELARTLTVEPDIFWTMYDRFADLIPTYEALYFQTSATPQTYGYNGQFTQAMEKVERNIKGFWDIPSQNIQVLAMHGTMLADAQRTYNTYRLFGFNNNKATANALAVRDALLASKTMNGGNYAFWTFNAVSFRAAGVGNKIVMGDGLLEGYAALGFSDVATQAIFAHEYGHQIQAERGYFDDLGDVSAPEATRYTELMADAMSAYFLTHARGEALNRFRVQEFLNVFFQIGDCAFDNPGHHGTPNQRMKAALFGFTVADESQKQGVILTSAQFHDRFLAAYPTLIAPDKN